MGRTKADSVELDPRPESSHVARTDQDDAGHVLRRNTAYGTVTDHGTVFVGFAAGRTPLHTMLERMAGLDEFDPSRSIDAFADVRCTIRDGRVIYTAAPTTAASAAGGCDGRVQ